jgi:hypothetical protein
MLEGGADIRSIRQLKAVHEASHPSAKLDRTLCKTQAPEATEATAGDEHDARRSG